jgi:hypothetical protein
MNTNSKNNELRYSANPLYPTLKLHGHHIDCVYDMSGTADVLCSTDSRRPSAEEARRRTERHLFPPSDVLQGGEIEQDAGPREGGPPTHNRGVPTDH